MAGQTFSLAKEKLTIGRKVTNDIRTDQSDLSVSRQHAQFLCTNECWTVKNISSSNNILINQKVLRPGQEQPVHDHDFIQLGTHNTFLFLTRQPGSPADSEGNGHSVLPQTVSATEQGKISQASLPTLEVTTNINSQHQHFSFPPQKQVINIGRAPAPANDLVIDELVVSAHHLQIRRENDQTILIHQKTTNGLLYQGKLYDGNETFTHAMSNGDVFRIGNEYGTLVTLTYHDGTGIASQSVADIPPITLGTTIISIGRHPTNTVVLTHPQISGNHAQMEYFNATYRIIDLNSTNHIYVNGQRVSNAQLNPLDIIRIGPYDLVYTGTQLIQRSSSKSIRIDAINIMQYGDKQKPLLNNISFTIPSGSFVAFVGGSGAGKTTLLDALNGTRPARQGHVLYNGQDYYATRATFSTQLGYVPQFDVIHKNLTVERALYYAAKLRLPDDTTNQQIEERLKEVMDAVNITQRRKLLIKKLSGGQQKRVSIALELLAKPNIFYLDEPTSGLDPGLDRSIMSMLRTIADKEGHTIILVTHATNNINICDYLCFLAPGGYLAYFGPPDEAKTYFGQPDFADIYSALEPTEADPHIPQKGEARFRLSPQYRQYVVQPREHLSHIPQSTGAVSKPPHGNPWKQFALLSFRYLELLRNDRTNLLVLLLQAPVVAVLLTLLIQFLLKPVFIHPLSPTAQELLFILSFVATFFGSNNAAREIVKEIHIYRREHMVNLGIIPYVCSKVVILGILSLLQCAILVIAVDIISPFPHTVLLPPLLEIYISLALTSLVGLMISSLTENSDQANSLIPLLLILQLLFSGVIFKLTGFARLIGALFTIRWSMIAMGSSVGFTWLPLKPPQQNYLGYFPNEHGFVSISSRRRACSRLMVCIDRDDRGFRYSHYLLSET